MVKINFTSKTEESLSILLTAGIGMLALVIGMTAVLAPGSDLFLFVVPGDYQAQGLLLALLGWGSMHEAKNQKRYSALKALLISTSNKGVSLDSRIKRNINKSSF